MARSITGGCSCAVVRYDLIGQQDWRLNHSAGTLPFSSLIFST
jgi:hypothetical protein